MLKIINSSEIIFETIASAQEFLWIVSFQLTDDSIMDALIAAESRGVDVRIITLPTDSYSAPSLRTLLQTRHQQIKGINYCEWEVGDPSLTSSSLSGQQRGGGGDKWYSLHAKFLVTERYALISSKNLNADAEWEVYYRSESPQRIDLLKRKFIFTYDLFCTPSNTEHSIAGRLFDKLDPSLQRELISANRLLVPVYAANMIPLDVVLADGFYLSPFDGIARLLIYQAIEEASEFIWIAGETFTDEGLSTKILARKANTAEIDIRVLARGLPRDAGKRAAMRETIMQLSGLNIPVRFISDWHAKILITDKVVMLGSTNLNQMNLGMAMSRGTWKANTESVFVSVGGSDIQEARYQFESAFQSGELAIQVNYKKATDEITTLLRALRIKARPVAREFLGRIQVALHRRRIAEFNRILRFSRMIQAKNEGRELIAMHIVAGVILWQLEKSAMTRDNLNQIVIEMVADDSEFENAQQFLESLEVIRQEHGLLSLNASALFPTD